MQEVTPAHGRAAAKVPGHYHRLPWPGRIHGLGGLEPAQFRDAAHAAVARLAPARPPAAAGAARSCRSARSLSPMSICRTASCSTAASSLRIAAALHGKPSAIIGDYNAVGPSLIPGFADVGPREVTHFGGNVVPFRLDRCLAHSLACTFAGTLDFGPSDHKPIVLDLQVAEAREAPSCAAARPPPPGQDPRGVPLSGFRRMGPARSVRASELVAHGRCRGPGKIRGKAAAAGRRCCAA